jgi:hypothetical protein
MRSILDFALPDASTRERLWRALLPEGKPRCYLVITHVAGAAARR